MTRFLIGTSDYPFNREKYREAFDVVELAVTRTSPPGDKALRRWASESPEGFVHVPSAWQAFTHEARELRGGRRAELAQGESPNALGHFRDSPENRRIWQQIKRSAEALRAPFILLETPASFTPSTEHKARLRAFARDWAELPEGVRLVWAPGGFWARDEAIELCRETGMLLAVDPILDPDEPLPEGPLAYFRMLGTGGLGGSYGDFELERLLEAAEPFEEVIVVFRTHKALRDARRLKQMLGPPGDEELDDDEDFDDDDDLDDDDLDDDDDFDDEDEDEDEDFDDER